jgi:uncharacterized MAPEG superfamily protein
MPPPSSSSSNSVTLSLTAPVFRSLVLGTAVLATKMFLTNVYSWFPRIFAGFGPPEDSFLARWFNLGPIIGTDRFEFQGASKDKPVHHRNVQAQEAYMRAHRVVMNDLENIPISIICFWVSALANPGAGGYISRLFSVFVAARCAHSALYLGGVTGLRGAAYLAGVAATTRAIVLGLAGVKQL